jgi:hypothetical protein
MATRGVDANVITLSAEIGGHEKTASHSNIVVTDGGGLNVVGGVGYAGAAQWQDLVVPGFDEDVDPGAELIIRFRTGGANGLAILCVCVYQDSDSGAATWVDLDAANQVLGDADYSNDAHAMKLLRDGITAVRGDRTPRNNIYCHWYRGYKKTNQAYNAYTGTTEATWPAAANGDLGVYRFIKREGVTAIDVKLLARDLNGPTPVKVMLYDWNGGTPNLISNQNANINSGPLTWVTFSFTVGGGTLASAETEYLLHIDADPTGVIESAWVPYVSVVAVPGGAVAHTVPDVDENLAGKPLIASEWDNVRTTLTHLWERGGVDIMISDWRWQEYDGALDQAFVGDGSTGANDPNKIGDGAGRDGGNLAVPLCRCLLFPSTSSTALRVRIGYKGNTGTTYDKFINTQISDNTAVFTTWDSVDEKVNTAGEEVVSQDIDGVYATAEHILEIPSADWESVATLPNVWCFMWSDDTTYAEYLSPLWVSIEEMTLIPDDFP